MARSVEDAATLQRLDEGLGVATRLFGDDIVALGQSGSQGVGVKIFVAETLPQVSGRAVKVNDSAEVHVRGAIVHDDVFLTNLMKHEFGFDFHIQLSIINYPLSIIHSYILLNIASTHRRTGVSLRHQRE